jgi:hypothetical protein
MDGSRFLTLDTRLAVRAVPSFITYSLDACTSIVAQTPDGKILHARNLDFWAGMGFTDTLKNMTFVANFQVKFNFDLIVTLSRKEERLCFKPPLLLVMLECLAVFITRVFSYAIGFKNKAFSVTIDTRFYPGGIGELFYEVCALGSMIANTDKGYRRYY